MSAEPQHGIPIENSFESPARNAALQGCENGISTRHELHHPLAANNLTQNGSAGKAVFVPRVGRDLPGRQPTEKVLRHSEENYRSIFENAPFGIYQANFDRLLNINPAIARMFGYDTPAEMLANAAEVKALWVQPGLRHQLACAAMKTDGYVQQELEYRRKDGTISTANLRMRAVRDQAGKNILFEGFVEDLTERKRAEMALRESETHYRLLADNMADLLWVFDLQTKRCAYVSPSVQRFRGYTPAEAMAQSMEQMLTPESLALVRLLLDERVRAYLAGDPAAITWVNELNLTRKDGSSVCTETVTTFVRSGDGGISVVGVSRDITERKRADEALRWRTALFEALMDSCPDGVLVVDSHGRKIVQNRRMIELWEVPPHIFQDPDDAGQVQFVTARTKNPQQFAGKVAWL